MLTIRLSRIGKKNKPMYRLIISEKSKDTYGRALEILGSYNPYTKELITKKERIEHWLSHGSQMSPTVNNLLIEKGVIKGDKVKASKARKKKKAIEEKADATSKSEEDVAKKVDKPFEEAANNKEEEKSSESPKPEASKEEKKEEQSQPGEKADENKAKKEDTTENKEEKDKNKEEGKS